MRDMTGIVRIRFAPDDLDELRAAAKDIGCPVSTLIRMASIAAARKHLAEASGG